MKPVVIIFVFCFCTHTFAQQLKTNNNSIHSYSVMNSQNLKSDSLNVYDLKNTHFLTPSISTINYDNFVIDSKYINRKFIFQETSTIDLKKELRQIMFKFPGDGNNLFLDARGLKTE